MHENDYEFVGEPAIEKNKDEWPIVSYWVAFKEEAINTH